MNIPLMHSMMHAELTDRAILDWLEQQQDFAIGRMRDGKREFVVQTATVSGKGASLRDAVLAAMRAAGGRK